MLRFIFITLFSFFYLSSIQAEVVKNIQIDGNKRISDETVKIYGGIKLNKDYSESDLNKILNNLYSTNFFKDVKVELVGGTLKVNLIEYLTIDTIVILGEPSNKYKEQIRKIISSKEKGSYIENNLANDTDLIKKIILKQVIILLK